MKTHIYWVAMLIFCVTATIANATLEISVETDNSVYQLGETVDISISVFNSSSTSEILYGGYYFTTYIMDDVYDWADRSGLDVVRQVTFLPSETKIWEMSHGFNEMQDYPLGVGIHSVVGGAGFSLISDPVEFTVVPEPLTLTLLALGAVFIRRK